MSVSLEISISGNLWSTVATRDFVAADFTAGGKVIYASDKPAEYVRANITIYNSGTAATSTLTAGGALTSGDTVTIDTKRYKFQTASLASEGYVLIGGSAATALAYLKIAINRSSIGATGDGIAYNCAAAHPSATASTVDATTLIVNATVAGTAGNSIALAETSGNLTWKKAAMSGGVDKGTVSAYYTPFPNE